MDLDELPLFSGTVNMIAELRLRCKERKEKIEKER